MNKIKKILSLSLLLLSLGLISCDSEEENISFQPGENLRIFGEDSFEVNGEESYFVEGFTITEEYTWSINGSASLTVVEGRDGEFVDVTAAEIGTYTITVSNNVGLEGSKTIEVVEPE